MRRKSEGGRRAPLGGNSSEAGRVVGRSVSSVERNQRNTRALPASISARRSIGRQRFSAKSELPRLMGVRRRSPLGAAFVGAQSAAADALRTYLATCASSASHTCVPRVECGSLLPPFAAWACPGVLLALGSRRDPTGVSVENANSLNAFAVCLAPSF
jgi:hypothetical protein